VSLVQQFLASTKTTVIPHPPYSLDLATCYFFLFLKMKLKGRHYDSNEEIQTESQNVMKTVMWNDFWKCFQSWKSHWTRSINAKGGYFKEDGVNRKFGKWLRYGRSISGASG
jgi:hypothetical protein